MRSLSCFGKTKNTIAAPITAMVLKAARATADFFIENTPTDGIPYWDTGAPETSSAFGFFAPFQPYFWMNSSTMMRAWSSGICTGGDFLKYDDGAMSAPLSP